MTDAELRHLADALSALLRPHLERSEPLRHLAAAVGRWLHEEAARAATPSEVASGVHTADPAASDVSATVSLDAPAPAASAAEESSPSQAPRSEEPAAPAPSTGPMPATLGPLSRVPTSAGYVPLRLGDAQVQVRLEGTTAELGRARQAAIPSGPTGGLAAGSTEHPGMTRGVARLIGQHAPTVALGLIETRSRLKAEACRLFIRKRALLPQSAEWTRAVERLRELIDQANALPSCFLWVFIRDQVQPDDDALRSIAGCYDALADGAALLETLESSAEPRHEAARHDLERESVQLFAEAHSALRVALQAVLWLEHDDRDQSDAHLWLRERSASRSLYIERHMRVDDPADPATMAETRERIAELRASLATRRAKEKDVKNALGRIRYHAGLVVRQGAEDARAHWEKIGLAIAALGELGMACDDPRIAEAIGGDAAEAWSEALDAIVGSGAIAKARQLAHRGDQSADSRGSEARAAQEGEEREWSAEVLKVRTLLRGRRMVVIGGVEKGHARERLVEAFELGDAEWVALSEHGPSAPMQAPIRRPDTALIVVIVKLAGHLHAAEARRLAALAGKPLVLLTGGYNPDRIAAEILEQASDRLTQRGRTG